MTTSLGVDIPVLWSYVRQVREATNAILAHYPPGICDATSMVASELVANAIKYGESIPQAPNAKFNLRITNGIILVEVTNGTKSQEHVDIVKARIIEITTAKDKDELYLTRLQDAMAGQRRYGQLGLYRVCCEGKFALDYQYSDHVLTILATREIA